MNVEVFDKQVVAVHASRERVVELEEQLRASEAQKEEALFKAKLAITEVRLVVSASVY